MNSVVRQLYEQGTDVVMVDTGNSYEDFANTSAASTFLYRGKTDYDEPIPHQSGGNESWKDGLPENLVLLIWKARRVRSQRQRTA